MEPGLDIVIVNYRTPGDLYECLMSIVDHPPSVPTDLHVAQVQPLDGDLRAVHIPLPLFAECGITVHPWQFDDNVGYNWAVNETVGRGSREFVAILNADVVFPGFTTARPSTFDALISRLDGHPDAAVVGPRQVDKDGLITAGGIFGTNLKPKHRAWKQPVRPGVADDVRLDSVTLAGSMMMWRRSAWNQLARCVDGDVAADIARGTGLRHPGGAFAPCFHYYGETWACMAEGSWVWTTRGPVEIQDVIAGDEVFGFDGYGLARGTVSKAGCTGVQEVFEIETKGRVLRATADHRVLTVSAVAPNGSGGTQGWKRVDELIPGDCIVAAVELPSETDVPRRGGKSIGDVELNREQLALRRVRSVVPVGESRTFDLTVPGLDSFVADGVVVHNCYHARAHGMPVVYDGTVTVVHKWHQASKVGGAGEQALDADRLIFRALCDRHVPPIERD